MVWGVEEAFFGCLSVLKVLSNYCSFIKGLHIPNVSSPPHIAHIGMITKARTVRSWLNLHLCVSTMIGPLHLFVPKKKKNVRDDVWMFLISCDFML
jgi:hypothetical protein